MKTSNRIIALVMAVAMLVCMVTFCVSAEGEPVIPTITVEQQSFGYYVLDGEKDAAYDSVAKIDYIKGVTDNINAEGWLAVDEYALWVCVDVKDATVDEKGEDYWDLDCVEVFIDWFGEGSALQYRVDRDGIAYDGAGATGEDMDVNFTGAATTTDEGYIAEFCIPLPANWSNEIKVSGFVQDLGSGEYTNMWETNHTDVAEYATVIIDDTIRIPYTMSGNITVDAVKDVAYNSAVEINYNGIHSYLDAKGWMTYDATNLYYYVEIYDNTFEGIPEGGAAWDGDNIELFVDFTGEVDDDNLGSIQYRISRAGVLSDTAENTGDEMVVTFTGATKELANGTGWAAELCIPVPEDAAAKIGIAGFANNLGAEYDEEGAMVADSGKWYTAYMEDITTVWTRSEYLDATLCNDVDVPLVDAEVALDGAFDSIYSNGKYIAFDNPSEDVTAMGYMVADGEYVYVFVDVTDDSVSLIEGVECDGAWCGDNIEFHFVGVNEKVADCRYAYRLLRENTTTFDDSYEHEAFEAVAVEKADGSGWYGEIKLPYEGTSFEMSVFVQDGGDPTTYDDDSLTDWFYKERSSMYNCAVVDDADDLIFEGAAPVKAQGTVNLMPTGTKFYTTPDTKGFTIWFSVKGLESSMTLESPLCVLDITHVYPSYEMKEGVDGVEQQVLDENGNPIVILDDNGNIVYASIETGASHDTEHHGQDGPRSATWTIEEDGDYLLYVPFENYALSHAYLGIDCIYAVSDLTLAVAVASSSANKNATITPKGIFADKVENFNTVLNADGEEVVLSGSYDYKAATPGGALLVQNIINQAEDYQQALGVTFMPPFLEDVFETDENGDFVLDENGEQIPVRATVDNTARIERLWTLAYVNEVLPEKVGEIENPIWFDAPEGGNFMIPNGNNRLFASANVSVTFRDEDGNDIEIVTVAPGTAAAPTATPTKEATEYLTFTFAGWVDRNGNAVDLSAVTQNIVVYASFSKVYTNKYIDVKDGAWFFDAVKYVTVNGLMNGISGNKFGPNDATTRAMVVTVLYRLEGEPAVTALKAHPFEDVAAGEWYSDAITWAYNNGVVNGNSATTFGPDDNITREAFAVIMYRYADEIKGYYVGSGRATLADLYDKNDVSEWASAAVKWAIADADDMNTAGATAYNKTPLLNGKSVKDDKPVLDPQGEATRAEMATMLERFIEGEHVEQ